MSDTVPPADIYDLEFLCAAKPAIPDIGRVDDCDLGFRQCRPHYLRAAMSQNELQHSHYLGPI